jgi:hypothetical protein
MYTARKNGKPKDDYPSKITDSLILFRLWRQRARQECQCEKQHFHCHFLWSNGLKGRRWAEENQNSRKRRSRSQEELRIPTWVRTRSSTSFLGVGALKTDAHGASSQVAARWLLPINYDDWSQLHFSDK